MPEFKRQHYEKDGATFDAPAYAANGWGRGVAWYVLGWETVADEDTEWSGEYVRTGKVLAVMVGDDRPFRFDEDDLKPVKREDFCGECGQIGCTHDAYDRSDT